MVFLHFPTKLTEEELMLQAKYAKLRKKKKQLAAHQNPSKSSESEKSIMSSNLNRKGDIEAKDSKEVAKKLIKTRAIVNIKKSVAERARAEKSTGFKRSQGLERKLTGMTDNARAGYQPFTGSSGGFDTGGEDMNPEPVEPPPAKKHKNLYDSFVTARDREERGLAAVGDLPGSIGLSSNSRISNPDRPRHGNTVYVYGYHITEEILQTAFTPMGKIVNISMEVEKHCGFITFDKPESAERAIVELNGTSLDGVDLKVTMARRQPVIDPINDSSSSTTWATIAASHSQKGGHKDKRNLVAYDEDVF